MQGASVFIRFWWRGRRDPFFYLDIERTRIRFDPWLPEPLFDPGYIVTYPKQGFDGIERKIFVSEKPHYILI
jgi:hypothetical protein